MVESPPADAGDTGSCPGPGGSHVPRSGWAREPWPLSLRVRSLCSATGEAAAVRDPRERPAYCKTKTKQNKKLNIELPYDTAIPLLGIYPEKTIIQKESCTPMFIAALFTIAQRWKQPKCPLTDG